MRIKIIVKTNAGKNEIQDFDEEKQAYKVLIKDPHVENKANKEIIKLFHKKYKLPIQIISGLKNKEKVLETG
ncbi:DUF167 domain-containing protein [Candidatus Woesearchaeota archaeon]|nr:DUF167 domain-containing protein [Candidatus Woesearchaeota archaeon]